MYTTVCKWQEKITWIKKGPASNEVRRRELKERKKENYMKEN